MGGYPFREKAARALGLARRSPCTCESGLPCLPCTAGDVLAYLDHVPPLVAPRARARPPLLAHTAAEGTQVDRGQLEQRCASCGTLLERGGRGTYFFPAGTVLYALPGQLTIGPELVLRVGNGVSFACDDPALSLASVTPLGCGPMRLVALLRVSSKGQARDGYGLEAQEADCRAWARANKARITHWIRETGSGETPIAQRDDVGEALQLVTAGRADGILVGRLDRLARDLIEQEMFIREIDHLDAVVRSAWPAEDVHLLDRDPQRVLIRQILGAMAQYDRAMIRMRLANGLRMKAAEGGYVGGRPPYGWVAKAGELVPLAAEQEVRRRIKEWTRSGDSLRTIAGRLNSEGIPTKNGAKWEAETVSRVLKNDRRAVNPRPRRGQTEDQRKAG